MKKGLKITLILSVILNVILSIIYFFESNRTFNFTPPEIKEVNIPEERNKMFTEIKKIHPELSDKKYFFFHAWSVGDWASMHQMPILDTMIEPLRNDFAYVFVNDEKADYSWQTLKAHTRKAKNFIYLNNMENFLTSIYQEKNMLHFKGYRDRMTPMNVVMDRKGNIVYFDTLKDMITVMIPEPDKKVSRMVDSLNRSLSRVYSLTLDSVFKNIK